MPQQPYRVLVIDDDNNIRMLTRLLFEFEGYEVLLASDGDEGLDLAFKHHPHLILLDMTMPGRDGLEVYDGLRARPETADIPVMVISASLNNREVAEWRSKPTVVDVITKPFDTYSLTLRIEELLAEGTPNT